MENQPDKILLDKVMAIIKRYQKIAELSGENFNVFKILRLSSSEVRTHSAFIAELLNTKGSHGQGAVFLDLFIKQILIELEPDKSVESTALITEETNIIEKLKNFDIESSAACVEHYIGPINTDKTEGGRIDILISDKNKKRIVIENKIYAGDQEKQLLRYYNFDKSAPLLYLTLYGTDPEDFNKEEKNQFRNNLLKISYYDTICRWLEMCRKEAAQMPLLREGITHYINLVKYLTNQSTSVTMNREIKDLIIESEDNFRAAINIGANLINAKRVIQEKFWKRLEEELCKIITLKEDEKIDEYYFSDKKIKEFYKSNGNKKNYYGICIEIKKNKEGVSLCWICEEPQELFTGFFLWKNNKCVSVIPENLKDKFAKAKFEGMNENANGIWLYRQKIFPNVNFNSNENIIALSNENKLQELVDIITKRAIIEIEIAKGIFNEIYP